MPFGPYADFDECVSKNADKSNPEAFCAWLHKKITGKYPSEMVFDPNQPRDPEGKWTPTGGASGPSGEDWAKSLDQEEIKSIHGWQISDWESIREYQKTGKGDASVKAAAERFENTLNKDGSYDGTTYRGIADMDDDKLKKLMSSKEITMRADSSSSADEKQARYFAELGDLGPSKAVMMEIKSKSGVDISAASHEAYKAQKEVILRKNTKYKVVGKSIKNGMNHLKLEEV